MMIRLKLNNSPANFSGNPCARSPHQTGFHLGLVLRDQAKPKTPLDPRQIEEKHGAYRQQLLFGIRRKPPRFIGGQKQQKRLHNQGQEARWMQKKQKKFPAQSNTTDELHTASLLQTPTAQHRLVSTNMHKLAKINKEQQRIITQCRALHLHYWNEKYVQILFIVSSSSCF